VVEQLWDVARREGIRKEPDKERRQLNGEK
jgi:hypothetical protein